MIIAGLLWCAAPLRSWHVAAAAVHGLLGIANLVFWHIFIAADMLAVGYVTTLLHGFFVVLQLYAVLSSKSGAGATNALALRFSSARS
jgi:hypothetical protein